MFQRGERVRYVPSHAEGDVAHLDVEYGVVSTENATCVFVRYYPQISRDWHGFEGATSQGTYRRNIVRGWGGMGAPDPPGRRRAIGAGPRRGRRKA